MADVLSGEVLVTGGTDCPPGLPNVETTEVASGMALVMEDDVPPEAPRVVAGLAGAVHSSMFVIVT